jgi:hypothetical protein
VAKNRNQNPNRRSEHQDQQRREQAQEAPEQGRSHQAEEHMSPSTTQVARKQQKRFGHN